MEDNKGKSSVVPEIKSSSDEFPLEIRVLVLENDGKYLSALETMLKSFGYSVSKCQRAKEALSLLEEDKSRYDIVLSDSHLPDMDGFKLLEKVGSEMALPVVLIISENKRDSIMEGFAHGASGYVIKCITSDSLGNLGEHVLLKKKDELIRVLLVGDAELQDTDISNDHPIQETLTAADKVDVPKNILKRVKDEIDERPNVTTLYDAIKVKKQRVIWTSKLHNMFKMAMEELGDKYAVPKKILEKMQNMGVNYLTRENIASHLQKYRMHNSKKENQSQTKNLLGLRPRTSHKLSETTNGELKIQSCTSPDQFSSPSLAPNPNSKAIVLPDQRNINPVDSSPAMGSDYDMVQQFSDDMGNLQPGETPDYYWNTNQYCQWNDFAPSRLMIDGPGYFPFGYECASVADAASMELNAATLQNLTMSMNYGFPLQVLDTSPIDSAFYGTNSFIDFAEVGGEEYVNLGNNAPFYNEPFVGNACYQTSVQAEQDFGYDFTHQPFIQQSGFGLGETK